MGLKQALASVFGALLIRTWRLTWRIDEQPRPQVPGKFEPAVRDRVDRLKKFMREARILAALAGL